MTKWLGLTWVDWAVVFAYLAVVTVLGVLAYRMLCGRLPFAAENLPELFDAIRDGPPACMLEEPVPEGLKLMISDCLPKEPDDRPRSPAQLLARIEDLAYA